MKNLFVACFSITHVWAIVLALQVNGFTIWGVVSALLTLTIPFLSETLWAFYAYKHGHPFLWAVVASAVLGVMAMALDKGEKES